MDEQCSAADRHADGGVMPLTSVPVVGGHVVVGHVAQLVHVGHGQRLARRAARVRQGGTIDVPVAAVWRVALSPLVQAGVVLGSHRVVPTRILSHIHHTTDVSPLCPLQSFKQGHQSLCP